MSLRVSNAERIRIDPQLLPQHQLMPRLPDRLQPRQPLQLPLMLEDERVPAGSPADQVLLAADVGGARVQDLSLSALQPLEEYIKATSCGFRFQGNCDSTLTYFCNRLPFSF